MRKPSALLLLLLLPDSMEYLLRAMFSDVPRRHHQHQHHRSSPRNAAAAAGGAAGAADGAGPEGGAGAEGGEAAGAAAEVVKCVNEKRALHVEVVLKRLRMPPDALAAAINLLNTDQLKVGVGVFAVAMPCQCNELAVLASTVNERALVLGWFEVQVLLTMLDLISFLIPHFSCVALILSRSTCV
jgi:hypothetical protein